MGRTEFSRPNRNKKENMKLGRRYNIGHWGILETVMGVHDEHTWYKYMTPSKKKEN